MSFIHWKVTLAVITIIPVYYILLKQFDKKVNKSCNESIQKEETMINRIQEDLKNFFTIRIFGIGANRDSTLEYIVSESEELKKVNTMTYTKANSYFSITSIYGIIILWCYGGYETINGHLTIGNLFSFSMFIGIISECFNRIFSFFLSARSSIVSLKRINELNNKIELRKDKNEKDIHFDNYSICINNISFSYDKSQPVLKNITLKIKPEEHVAITGKSGNGKTTLCNLFLNLFNTSSGEITIGNRPLNKIPANQLSKIISMVPQNAEIFNGTIRDNILLWRNFSEADLINASQTASAHNFITNLDKSYDTILHSSSPGLSHGQLKRILIARALLSDPKILILDEITADLDKQTEIELIRSICTSLKNKTIIYITHKPLILQYVSHIYELSDGNLCLIQSEKDVYTERKPDYAHR
jgi:ATP-binding cassette subfamily B protein